MTILLTILKIIGILLLVLLGILVILAVLVIFVPVRYRISIRRKEEEGAPPLTAEVKVTWLLRIFGAAFSYPEAAYIRVRVLGLTLFRSDKAGKKDKAPKELPEGAAEREQPKEDQPKPSETEAPTEELPSKSQAAPPPPQEGMEKETDSHEQEGTAEADDDAGGSGFVEKVREFFSRLLAIIKNIRYTIRQICDKIKDIVNNIQYYISVIKSDAFHRTWILCSGQAKAVLRSIRPRKIKGKLLIGTGDPAGTGQVLALYGILYPFLGNHIEVEPDFERKVLEGELFIKGKITVFRFLRTGWSVFFNRDLRRLLKLLKREAA